MKTRLDVHSVSWRHGSQVWLSTDSWEKVPGTYLGDVTEYISLQLQNTSTNWRVIRRNSRCTMNSVAVITWAFWKKIDENYVEEVVRLKKEEYKECGNSRHDNEKKKGQAPFLQVRAP